MALLATRVRALAALLGLVLGCAAANAQVVFSAKYKFDADVKVYVTRFRSEADLVVYRCRYKFEATGNRGLWYFTSYKFEAKKRIYFTDFKSDADLIVCFTGFRSEAGWRNRSKMRLMD